MTAEEALTHVRQLLGGAWLENIDNPAVKLLACESQVAVRVNSYSADKWVHRRVGEDTLVAMVELKDGSQEQRKFYRGVLDSGWKRASA